MTDIYPQSEPDSHALLQEQHPLAAEVERLKRELADANLRAETWLDAYQKASERAQPDWKPEAVKAAEADALYFRAQNGELRKNLSAAMRVLKHTLDYISAEDL